MHPIVYRQCFIKKYAPITFLTLFLYLFQGCSRYHPSSFEDCPWQVRFPEQPELQTIFDGKVVRKQRAQVKQEDHLYRTSCTLWKRRKHKETDQRWIQRTERLFGLNMLNINTQKYTEYSHVKILANQNCPGPDCLYYWLDSYFDGTSRFVLIYRQPTARLDIKGEEFLRSVRKLPSPQIHSNR